MGRRPGGRRFNVGQLSTATDPGTLRDAFAEFLASAIFLFAAEGATLSFLGNENKQGLLLVAVAHALALAGAVASTLHISGGHLNPAITFGALLGGHVCLVRSIIYWTAQLLGALTAQLLLRITFTTTGTGGGPDDDHHHHGVVLEAAMAFGLMYAYYATAIDPRRRTNSAIVMAPLAVGLLAGANVLAFHGAVMNPTQAIVGAGLNRNHLLYWAGPLLGAGLAGLVYEHLLINPPDHIQKPPPTYT